MSSRDSTPADLDPSRRRRRRLGALIAMVITVVLSTPASSGQAAPTQPVDPREELDRLEGKLDQLDEKADDLAKRYRGELHALNGSIRAARRAGKRVRQLERREGEARDRLAELAAARYKSGAIDPVIMLATSDDPGTAFDQAAVAEHLAQRDQDRLREMRQLMKQRQRAEQEAESQVTKAQQVVDRLEARKDKIAELVAKYEKEAEEAEEAEEAARRRAAAQAAAESGSSSGSSGSSGSSSGQATSPVTGGGSSITPRMQQVLTEIDSRFGPFPTIGCWRSGTFGEHPLGRACDFMLSTGGTMPSAGNVQRGWDVSNWARANAERLGIMYIIYRQQIWDIRCSCGWEPMEDRGSITANHYDHVHISVF